jgi:hypothetical protein
VTSELKTPSEFLLIFRKDYNMKITTCPLIIFFLLAYTGLYSQTQDPTCKASVLIGPAFPIGNFAANSPDSGTVHSAALPGPALSVSLSYKFRHSRYGLELMGGWQQNNVDNSMTAKSVSESSPPGSGVYAKSDNWHIWKLLAGPLMETSLRGHEKISLECAVLAGMLKTMIPGHEVGVVYPNYSGAEFSSAAPIPFSPAFCYQLNAGVNYRLTQHLLLAGDLSFMHAAPVRAFTYYQNPLFFTGPVNVRQSYTISTLNILLGVSYTF